MAFRTIILLSCLAGFIEAQVPFLGACPELKTMTDFDSQRYMGKWYEAERYFSVFEFGGKCVQSNYTDGIDNNINIISKQTSSLTGAKSTVNGAVKKNNSGNSAQMHMTFPYLPVDAPYWVLETDYDTYAVVWSCTNFGLFSARNAWILTRDKNPPLKVMEKAYSVIDRNLISRAFFIRTDQNCPEEF
ncbi:unnamed protein product [Nezara viridula]|uniref:Lipocalin/cytosolic fatty-acid binding domain-containing protein n=1 Tax=Nezara viridula TaxID=85310 RepID=A0A9P0MS72_NEZVI|nr:unnamed protein product [Nezara viridula]